MFESVENLEFLETVFVNPFAIVEIVANFQEMISGFIQSLPKFQVGRQNSKKKINLINQPFDNISCWFGWISSWNLERYYEYGYRRCYKYFYNPLYK